MDRLKIILIGTQNITSQAYFETLLKAQGKDFKIIGLVKQTLESNKEKENNLSLTSKLRFILKQKGVFTFRLF